MADQTLGIIKKGASAQVRISSGEYRGSPRIDIRDWYLDEDGEPKPTRKGVSIRPEDVPAVITALQKALEEGAS